MVTQILQKQLREKYKGESDLFYEVKVYKLKLALFNLLFFITLLGLSCLLGVGVKFLLIFPIFPLLKPNIGGIHFSDGRLCFIFSGIFILFLIYLLYSNYVISTFMEIILWVLNTAIIFKYVPQGTLKIPFKNREKNKQKKLRVWGFYVILILIRLLGFEIYTVFLVGFSFLLLLVTPMAYRLLEGRRVL